jgi:hypothetical protein
MGRGGLLNSIGKLSLENIRVLHSWGNRVISESRAGLVVVLRIREVNRCICPSGKGRVCWIDVGE